MTLKLKLKTQSYLKIIHNFGKPHLIKRTHFEMNVVGLINHTPKQYLNHALKTTVQSNQTRFPPNQTQITQSLNIRTQLTTKHTIQPQNQPQITENTPNQTQSLSEANVVGLSNRIGNLEREKRR